MERTGSPPASPDEYVQSIRGWQRQRVDLLRAIAKKVGDSDETVKWGHLVYLANGPAFLIRAENHRVLFGFWRGKRLLDLEPRMKGSGKYEMLSLELREDTPIDPAIAEQLIRKAIEFNRTIGNPAERS